MVVHTTSRSTTINVPLHYQCTRLFVDRGPTLMHLHTGATRLFARKEQEDRVTYYTRLLFLTRRIRLDLTEKGDKYIHQIILQVAFVFLLHVLCSRMDQTTTMLGDCLDHYHDQGLPRPLPCSWTTKTTAVLGDCSDHCYARGLLRPLLCSGTASTTTMLGDCSDHYHTQEPL